MLLEIDTDRFEHEGERRFTSVERETAALAIKVLDEAREQLRVAAYAAANAVALANKAFIDLDPPHAPAPLQLDEAIEGMVECIDDNFADLLNTVEINRARCIAEIGEDEE